MSLGELYTGRRLSLAGALCTVRYIGSVPNTTGEWLGVEWDDPSRGKHNGTHEGKRLFECLSDSPTAASFVRPSRKADPERTLLEAIQRKYGGGGSTAGGQGKPADEIAISGKIVLEVGFDKIARQQSVLEELRVVLVDELVVSGVAQRGGGVAEIEQAQESAARTCPAIVELDVGWNVVEDWGDVLDMARPFEKLRALKAGGNRLKKFAAPPITDGTYLPAIEELHLNECLLRPTEIIELLESSDFRSLKTLVLSSNNLYSFADTNNTDGPHSFSKEAVPGIHRFPTIKTLVLENNHFTTLASVIDILHIFSNTTTLSLQGNAISAIGDRWTVFHNLTTLNLAGNQIPSYAFVDTLHHVFPNLASLRISRNPLYDQQPQTAGGPPDSSAYYLTLARIPTLTSLNYTAITPRDREEGELYYLSVADKALPALLDADTTSVEQRRSVADAAHTQFSRYTALCAKHDRTDLIARFVAPPAAPAETDAWHANAAPGTLGSYAPGTLGSKLVEATFCVGEREVTRTLPRTVRMYVLKAMVKEALGVQGTRWRLVYESGEFDPVRDEGVSRGTADEDWGNWDVDCDHEEDHDEAAGPQVVEGVYVKDGQRFRRREVDMLDGMRSWGDFLDGSAKQARIRVEEVAAGV